MNLYHPYTIFPLGDSALTIDFGNLVDDRINKKVLKLFRQISQKKVSYITDLVPAYSSLTVYYDLQLIHDSDQTSFETVAELIETMAHDTSMQEEETMKLVEVPVCYEGKYAPDLYEIAAKKKLSPEEVIAIHTSKSYRVFMLGFLPGFAYMGETDERIGIPRKTEPRLQVAAGSVGIAGQQTGIYPLTSPGGWQIIGRTPIQIFNKHSDHPVLLEPGDEVRFHSISEDEFKDYQKRYS